VSDSLDEKAYHVTVAVGRPADLTPLLMAACTLAQARSGRVTVLTVTPDGHRPDWLDIPKEPSPAEPRTEQVPSILPDRCQGVPVEVMVRLGTHAGGAILAAVREDTPDLLILGWSGEIGRGQYLLGSTLDPLTQKAPCDIAIVRIGGEPERVTEVLTQMRHVLVPMRGDVRRGGANAALAVDLALNLSPEVEITALNIAQLSRGRAGMILGREQLASALQPWKDNERIQPKVVQAPGVVGGILNEAKSGYDLLLIGASRESYIDRMLFGNVPQTIATSSPLPTIVVKRREGWQENVWRRALRRILEHQPSLMVGERVEVYRSIRRGARPDIDFYLMIGLSATISALGLLLNSAATIIGAMLVAPLMSAIVGLGLGVVQGDWRLLRTASGATFRGMVLAVVIGVLMGLFGLLVGLLDPTAVPTAEIQSRISPSILDLGVALASGAAGAYAMCRRDVSAALPGVAIAAALVPPLSVIGIGVALADGQVTGGALLLFLTNFTAISAAGGLVFLWLGFRPQMSVQSRARVFRGGVVTFVILILIVTVPLVILTINTLRESNFRRVLVQVLQQETAALGQVQLVDWHTTSGERDVLNLEISVRATREPTYQEVVDLQKRLAVRLQRAVALQLTVIPVTRLNALMPPTFTPTPIPTPTATPGPSATATNTPVPTATSTTTPTPTSTDAPTATPAPTDTPIPSASPTATLTPTATPTNTPTNTPTPTPVSGVIRGTGGLGVLLHWTPAGTVAGALREGAQVLVLNERETVENQEWVMVRDDAGRLGWIAVQFVQQLPWTVVP
jgi:uncharacterized hydrophobic protein (TIGR00271 family)